MATALEILTELCCNNYGCPCLKSAKDGKGLTHCPCLNHPDRHPSLSVDEKDGKVLFNCLASCTQDQVQDGLTALGLWGTRSNESLGSTNVPVANQAIAIIPNEKLSQAEKKQYLTDEYIICDFGGSSRT